MNHQEYYQKNKIQINKRKKEYYKNNPEARLAWFAKNRANKRNLEYDITKHDIKIPEYCPVLGIKLEVSTNGKLHHGSPSIDRIDNSKGYLRDNINIISFRANSLKKDGTIEEFKKIIEYMESLKG